MPVFRNVTSKPYFEKGVEVPAFDTKETLKILTESDTLIRINDEPYYNPNISNTTLTYLVAGNQSVVITNIDDSVSALIWNITTCDITVYLNSLSNTPFAGPLAAGQTIEVVLNKSVDLIICAADGAGSCQVTVKSRKLAS